MVFSGLSKENCIRTGKARRITREECCEILRKAEEKGFVHEVTNTFGPEESTFIVIATGLPLR